MQNYVYLEVIIGSKWHIATEFKAFELNVHVTAHHNRFLFK
jgi:hypothetical protein